MRNDLFNDDKSECILKVEIVVGCAISVCVSSPRLLKPGFHMIVRIVSIVPVVPKNVQTIGTTETIADFHMIVSIASKTEVGLSTSSL